ncbi:MAG: glycerol-3-phosphate dehydrogenase/oxidase [Acidimicrobiia bacterium]
MASSSGAWTRANHLGLLANGEGFDVLVIGGGVIGCGVALDLAARGLHVAVVEQHDFAAGTSGRSTKLFHGGIRYLPQFRFQLVAEGLREQEVLARIADYLFEPLEFVVPVYRNIALANAPDWVAKGRRGSLALRAGLLLYDLLGGLDRPGSRHRRITLAELETAVPRLRTEGLRFGFVYSDAQTDDVRLVIAIVRTAVDRYGAVAVNRLQATAIDSVADGYSVTLRDGVSTDEFRVRSRAVVVASGAFPPPAVDGSRPLKMTVSKGAHLVVEASRVGLGSRAVVLPRTDDGRILYIIPWAEHALIGTTDTLYQGNLAHPAADHADIDYLIRHVQRYLDVPAFEPLSTFAGLRALMDGASGQTAKASRAHVLVSPRPGYVQVAGGKLTTYRRISADAAKMVARSLKTTTKSPTESVRLVGSGVVFTTEPDPIHRNRLRRYGTHHKHIERIIMESPELARIMGDGRTALAEAVHAVRHESAVSISDFTLRRTRLGWLTHDHARKDQRAIAAVMAKELGWSANEVEQQINDHEAELTAEGL